MDCTASMYVVTLVTHTIFSFLSRMLRVIVLRRRWMAHTGRGVTRRRRGYVRGRGTMDNDGRRSHRGCGRGRRLCHLHLHNQHHLPSPSSPYRQTVIARTLTAKLRATPRGSLIREFTSLKYTTPSLLTLSLISAPASD